jgi:hypothetical protein
VIKALGAGLDLSGLAPGGAKPDKTVFVYPYAITSPIWIDTTNDGWIPPKPPLTRAAKAHASAPPDLRAAFDALPGGDP